jgi:hypothetical protein
MGIFASSNKLTKVCIFVIFFFKKIIITTINMRYFDKVDTFLLGFNEKPNKWVTLRKIGYKNSL